MILSNDATLPASEVVTNAAIRAGSRTWPACTIHHLWVACLMEDVLEWGRESAQTFSKYDKMDW